MTKSRRTVLWTNAASERHDGNALDIALQYGEQAAHTYLDGIDDSLRIIAANPQIGRCLLPHLPNRRWHVTARGWEIVYEDHESVDRIVVIDIRRGTIEHLR